MAGRAALLVIDVQDGLISGFENDWVETLPVTDRMLARARAASSAVVIVQHCGSGSGHPLPVRSAASLGYDVDLVADAHTTSDSGLLSRRQIVAHHNQTLANLALVGVSVRVLPSAEVRF